MRLRKLVLATFAAATLAASVASLALAADGNKCQLEHIANSPTEAACKQGGRKEAAKVMKKMVKAAKAKGVVFVCDDCHKDNESYQLSDNAKKDFEKLLAATK